MTELDVSRFTDPNTKNAEDLVVYVTHAWESGWGYVWGTFGQTLTESLFESKLRQYPEGVGNYEEFIRSNWLGGRTADCVGLIKGYGWLDADALTIRYGTNGMPDIGADAMYRNAKVKGASTPSRRFRVSLSGTADTSASTLATGRSLRLWEPSTVSSRRSSANATGPHGWRSHISAMTEERS